MAFLHLLLAVSIVPLCGGLTVEYAANSDILQELLQGGKLHSAELVARQRLDEVRLEPAHAGSTVAEAYQQLATILLD